MGRARAPGTRSPPPPPLPPGRLLLLLLLSSLLLSPTVRGDCGLPPEIPNATPELGGQTSFSEQSSVVYSCNKGFQKIPDKQDTVLCLENGQWSPIEAFCNKSCDAPTRLFFASLKKEYNNLNYFPIGTTVEYECRPGFQRKPSLSGISTCLENLEWSKVAEFCKKKSCRNPGEIKNGHINIVTDILFGSEISFSCNTGYRLVGSASSFCSLLGNTVDWSDPFPVCTEIFCPDPPEIENGRIKEESDTYAYRHAVTYVCDKGFILLGKSSIYCNVEDDQGKWSDLAPQCIEKSKIPSTSPKPTTVNVPDTRVSPTSQKPTTVNVPGTRVPPTSPKPATVNAPDTRVSPTSQKPTTVNVPVTQRVPATKTTTHHPPGTSKDKERSTSDGNHLIYGHTCLITLTVLHVMLLLTGQLT
ncbi:complement decay-accelerating factor isoform X2 [Peromyscus californicus insignis]|uniref:complement decay-accelerating factor isoform X2 n=1 Tax=Peromyscus californicus insignis TaxID=564181 RepID=UPI0022A6A46B|nr:complement decay-accelerating factor isoform X2 [Peromyscus californicus insignis]